MIFLIKKEFESLCSQFYVKLKEVNEETEKMKAERDEYKNRLEQRDKDQSKMDSKIKALEKVINTNNFRTPMQNGNCPSTNNNNNSNGAGSSGNKENRAQFVTPSRTNNSGNIAGLVTGGSGSSTGGSNVQAINDRPPSSASTKTPLTMRSETPITSTYRSSRIIHTTSSQVRAFGFGVTQSGIPPPATPSKDNGVIVANKRNTRRSKSAEMWLDHKPPNMAKIDTVMQPKLNRKKSVSKVELTDTKKSSKYALTHQQQDDDGEVITNIIKVQIPHLKKNLTI